MAASYPGAIKNFLALEDGVDKVIAAHPNDRAAEITAIETELGTDVAGSAADLKTRLAVAINDNGVLKVVGVASGGLGTTLIQRGHTTANDGDTITFPTTFGDTNYVLFISINYSSGPLYWGIQAKSATNFVVRCNVNGFGLDWLAIKDAA